MRQHKAPETLKLSLLGLGIILLCARACEQEYKDALFYEALDTGFYRSELRLYPDLSHEQILERYIEFKKTQK